MLYQRMVGLIRSSFIFGSLNTSCNMPSTVGPFSCSLMATAHTLSLTQSTLPKSKMWWSFAYHHIPPMNVNRWIALCLGHLRYTGGTFVTSFIRRIPMEPSQSSISLACSSKHGSRQFQLKILSMVSRNLVFSLLIPLECRH